MQSRRPAPAGGILACLQAFRFYFDPGQDRVRSVDLGRRTEIDVLNGAIVRGAREAGVSVPLNQAVTALIYGLEQCWA